MSSDLKVQECIVQEGCINIPYTWSVGATGSFFLSELRDRKRIWGTRCTACGVTFTPPRNSCGRCYHQPLDWVELGPCGTLRTFTVVRYSDPAIHPVPAPLACGIIKLDGADTGLVHLLGEVEPGEIMSGIRVEAVFSETPQGSVLDIKYFRPVSR